ncbi:hypothetical protein [Geminicoccus flavidas]|uniref:hypothetical protein n=1 Tax=Geminicoccus flavidas TaxID=2506407 RepID=UPI00135CC7B3|nr:hypothetical protein [Geminicoccus flavidas]
MAIFGQLSRDEILQEFTHYGMIYGCVPVYLGDPYGPAPLVQVRNWWPEWILGAADAVFGFLAAIRQSIDPTWEHPGFPIAVLGKIEA